jgi:hypothetical protein
VSHQFSTQILKRAQATARPFISQCSLDDKPILMNTCPKKQETKSGDVKSEFPTPISGYQFGFLMESIKTERDGHRIFRVLARASEQLYSRLANNQVTCQDLLACLLTLASKQASHEASFFPSKQVVEALLACLLVGLVGWRFRRRIAGSMAKIANNKVHR